jgi:long-chain acyl-CoA synthetase
MERESAYTRWIFNKAINTKLEQLKETAEVTHSVYDKLIFSKIKEILGGRVRFFITGGAPISQEVMDYIKVAFSAPMLQAYGITETCGFTCCSSVWETRAGVVGGPLPCLKMKLIDIPALGYLTTDSPPRGEVLVKGNSVFKGYFRNQE